MKSSSSCLRPGGRGSGAHRLAIAIGVLAIAASSSASAQQDPRVGLGAGWWDAQETISNLRIVSKTQPSEKFLNPSTPGDARLVNSDIGFSGHYVFQGNYSGYQVWDISDISHPTLKTAFVCPGSQSDVTLYKNLMFVSAEAVTGRVDCGMQGVEDTVSNVRARGIRIFDITDVANPKSVKIVQTCRGSHTNTLVTDPKDKANVYIYVSGSSTVRSPNELAGCSDATPDMDPNSALFRLEVIKIPVAHPELAAIVSSPRVFQGLAPVARHGESPEDSAAAAARQAAAAAQGRPQRPPRPGQGLGPNQCHDITAYPAAGVAGGACQGYGIILDIRDPEHPQRIGQTSDPNFAAWHSVMFNNDASKIIFSDEWGGGSQPRCRATDNRNWGGDAIYTLDHGKMEFQSYYKLPVAQTPEENCVAHNGSAVPIPGRDIMLQSWYQGGLDLFDWTDPKNPKEIAYFDRGPMDKDKLILAGYWSAYWYNGYIFGSEITRGLDIFELAPSEYLSQNEIDAAKLVHFDQDNAQDQTRFVWPAAFVVARAYADQLERSNGVSSERLAAIRASLDRAERLKGAPRRAALTKLAAQLAKDANGSSDAAKVGKLAAVVKDLAK
jgi:hypothetical protein